MVEKVLEFHVSGDDGHMPMKVTPGSVGCNLWPSCDITLQCRTITKVDTGVRVIIPSGYAGVIHVKSGLAMEGIITITGIIDADFHGEIGLMMHNITETDYKVLKENPLAQLVVYKVDRLPVIYHASGHMSLKVNLQVVHGEKGFGEVTTLLQANLTDDLSDCEIPCSGAQVHEVWQPSAKSIIMSGHKLHTITNANLLVPIPSAPCKKRLVVPPKPVTQ